MHPDLLRFQDQHGILSRRDQDKEGISRRSRVTPPPGSSQDLTVFLRGGHVRLHSDYRSICRRPMSRKVSEEWNLSHLRLRPLANFDTGHDHFQGAIRTRISRRTIQDPNHCGGSGAGLCTSIVVHSRTSPLDTSLHHPKGVVQTNGPKLIIPHPSCRRRRSVLWPLYFSDYNFLSSFWNRQAASDSFACGRQK